MISTLFSTSSHPALFKSLPASVFSFTLWALCVSPAFAHSDAAIQIMKGQAIDLDLRQLCEKELSECSKKRFSISREPSEGFVYEHKDSDLIRYQHAGTSEINDSFVFKATGDDGQHESVRVELTVTTETPVLLVTSPKPGAVIKAGDVEIRFVVEGEGADHVHLALLQGEHVSVPTDAGSHIFKDVKPGSYKVTGSLATATHNEIYNSAFSLPLRVVE